MPAGTLPPLAVSGNNRDQVRLSSVPFHISGDLTLKKRGAPYHFKFDRVTVFGPSTPTLTIEPGVELRLDDYLRIGDYNPPAIRLPGKLIAVGTPTEPIVFTSAKPNRAAGDWPGIFLLYASGSRLENVRIEYAGGRSGIISNNCRPNGSSDDAALLIGWGYNPTPYIPLLGDFSNVTIANTYGHGINAMWMAAGFGPALTGGFTFHNVAGCRQTKNGRVSGCGGEAGCLVP